jgi:hypothetical protein
MEVWCHPNHRVGGMGKLTGNREYFGVDGGKGGCPGRAGSTQAPATMSGLHPYSFPRVSNMLSTTMRACRASWPCGRDRIYSVSSRCDKTLARWLASSLLSIYTYIPTSLRAVNRHVHLPRPRSIPGSLRGVQPSHRDIIQAWNGRFWS